MKDFEVREHSSATRATVRNEWRRGVISENGRTKPDHVLLDVGVLRGGEGVEWNSISLTPAKARKVAAALLKAAGIQKGQRVAR